MQTSPHNAASPIEMSWSTVERMTASLHAAADEKNWGAVLEQAAARHLCLEQHFAKYPVGPENADFYRTSIGKLLDGEKKLDALVRNARKSLMVEGAAMSRNHRAVGAYLKSSTA